MHGRSNASTLQQLVRDTFRQANASGISWMMLAVTGICVALCLSISIADDVNLKPSDDDGPRWFLPSTSPHNPDFAKREGVETLKGRMTLAFGAMAIPMGRERGDAVRFLELLLAGGIAGTLGLLLALVWTAGFVPTFLEASSASVLLAKPVGRRHLLLGKYLGVLTFVGFHVVLFVVLTWLALGLRTDVWDMAYWWCIPLLILQFAIFYSFSVLLAVLTHSTVACVFGSVLFWLLTWGINYGSARASDMRETLPSVTVSLAKTAYWVSPKPIDAGVILFNALDAQSDFAKPEIFQLIEKPRQSFSPLLSILSSLAITVVLLELSVYEFKHTDY